MSDSERTYGEHPLKKLQQEMDAMWEHIRNLEQKLLTPSEMERYKQAKPKDVMYASHVNETPVYKPNCY